MPIPVRAGLLLGILVTIWTFVIGLAGWYKDPMLVNLFFLVIFLQIGVIIWALRRTAVWASYGQQVLNGLILSAVASLIIFFGSLVFTTVAFPSYFSDLQKAQGDLLRAAGMSDADIAKQLEASGGMQTPLMNAVSGVVGTLATGLVVSAIAAFFLRRK